MQKNRVLFHLGMALVMLTCLTLTSCGRHRMPHAATGRDTIAYTEKQLDSIAFAHTHHYSHNYNFLVTGDSLVLLRQQPEEYLSGMQTDTMVAHKGEMMVVADIRIIPYDEEDSVWVQLARDQYSFGWTRESRLLKSVVPDDPISQFISLFADSHLLISVIVVGLIAIAYLLMIMLRKGAKLVVVNDIPSIYPTLLTLTVSTSASFYSSIQMFAADSWQDFYYHPTLNPFSVSPLLAIFLTAVWLIMIVTVACIDEVRRMLPFDQAMLYLFGLMGVCAVCYIVFSLTTLYYVGYPLLAAYYWYALRSYLKNRTPYACGQCGMPLHTKGKCPHCGAVNE